MEKHISRPLYAIDMAATGHRIQHLRLRAGLSVRDLQTCFGFITPQAIYKWQRGQSLPTLDNMVMLAQILGVTVDEIIVYSAAREAGTGEEDDPDG